MARRCPSVPNFHRASSRKDDKPRTGRRPRGSTGNTEKIDLSLSSTTGLLFVVVSRCHRLVAAAETDNDA
jgi:hypothetical protein